MSWRVLLISAALIPANALWMMTGSLWNAGYPTTVSLFFNTILYLFVLTGANFGLRRVAPRAALSELAEVRRYRDDAELPADVPQIFRFRSSMLVIFFS